MSWSRFDDLYDDHPKVMAATHACPLAAALHPQAITASSRRESDGLVDPFWLIARAPDKRRRSEALDVLVEVGLFDVLEPGETLTASDAQGFEVTLGPFQDVRYVVHDYLEYNPSSAQLQDRRRRDAERKASGRRKDSARNPEGVRADISRTPDGPRGRAGAGPQPSPIPSHPKDPPDPPEQAREGQDTDVPASLRTPNPRSLGTNPRAAAKRAAQQQAAAVATEAAGALADADPEHRDGWERLHAAMQAGTSTDLRAAQYVERLELAGVDPESGALVVDGPPDAWGWARTRLVSALASWSEAAGVSSRLASSAEHQGLQGAVA